MRGDNGYPGDPTVRDLIRNQKQLKCNGVAHSSYNNKHTPKEDIPQRTLAMLPIRPWYHPEGLVMHQIICEFIHCITFLSIIFLSHLSIS
ncbi:hypothetical protein D3C73_1023000 [compost metagenome]